MTYRFEDYAMKTGKLRYRPGYWASIEEFGSLVADGLREGKARHKLRPRFDERVRLLQSHGEPLPVPGSGKRFPKFAPNDQIEQFRPLVDDFWEHILGTSYSTSFVSNESTLEVWEQMYVPALFFCGLEKYSVNGCILAVLYVPITLQAVAAIGTLSMKLKKRRW